MVRASASMALTGPVGREGTLMERPHPKVRTCPAASDPVSVCYELQRYCASARPRARSLPRGGSAAPVRTHGARPASDPPQRHSISLTRRADANG